MFPSLPAFRLASLVDRRNSPRMEKPDQLRELFRMQRALDERIGFHHDDSKHI